jgi:hypothetical protein
MRNTDRPGRGLICLMDQFADPCPPHLIPGALRLSIPGKIDDQSLSQDIFERKESPETTVFAVITVVTHDEQGIFGHSDGTVVLYPLEVPFRPPSAKVPPGIGNLLVIDVYFIIDDLNLFSLRPDDPLNKILGWILGKMKTITSPR